MVFIGRRAIWGLATVFVSSVLVFLMIRMVPGDPASVLLGRDYSPDTARSLRLRYGLEGPLYSQYLEWARAAIGGDFGRSFITDEEISNQLAPRIYRTFELLVGGLLVALIVAVPSGIYAARRRGTVRDTVILSFNTIMLSMPHFVLGIFFIFFFAVTLRWLPAGGWIDPDRDFGGWIQGMILPWLTIGLTVSAFTSRVLRSSMIEASLSDYVRTARSWALSERQITYKHVLRNASIPTVTVIGLEVGYLLGGAIVVEQVFAYPGMGQYIINAISNRDYAALQAAIMIFAVGFVLVNLIVDLITFAIDPRIRKS